MAEKHNAESPSNVYMHEEAKRLASFVNCLSILQAVTTPSTLARHGFYHRRRHNSRKSEVVCFECDLNLDEENISSCPIKTHGVKSPRCPMVRHSSAINVLFGPEFEPAPKLHAPSQSRSDTTSVSDIETDSENDDVSCHVSSASSSNHPELPYVRTLSSGRENSLFLSAPTIVTPPVPIAQSVQRGIQAGCADSAQRMDSRTLRALAPPGHNHHVPSNASPYAHGNGTTQPNQLIDLMTEADRRRELRREKMRRVTFENNWPPDTPVSAEEVAKAGFFYIGPADRVRCAFCYNVLRMWEDDDVPEKEHRRYFPRCPMIINPAFSGNISLEEDSAPLWSPANRQVYSSNGASDVARRSSFEQVMKSDVVNQVTLGYSASHTQPVMEQQFAGSANSTTRQQQLRPGNGQREQELGQFQSSSEQEMAHIKHAPGDMAARQSHSRAVNISVDSDEDEQDTEKLQQLYRELKDARCCKICMENDADMALLPCGHLCCCGPCASRITACPICRSHIKGIIKVYQA